MPVGEPSLYSFFKTPLYTSFKESQNVKKENKTYRAVTPVCSMMGDFIKPFVKLFKIYLFKESQNRV